MNKQLLISINIHIHSELIFSIKYISIFLFQIQTTQPQN